MKIKQYHWSVIYLVILCIGLVLSWLNQHSINAYWQQTYHTPSWLQKLDDYAWWRKGAELKQWLAQEQESVEAEPAEAGETSLLSEQSEATTPSTSEAEQANVIAETPLAKMPENRTAADTTAQTAEEENASPETESEEILRPEQAVHPQDIFARLEQQNQIALNVALTHAENQAATETQTAEAAYPDKIRLGNQDMVFFAGDSLMQGVAPYVQQWLTKHAVKSINLSKQSTGLSYPKFFNWPATIEETLQKHPEIKLLVIFLGPNDPWDIPDPEKPKSKFLRFKEAEWESIYRQRVSHILESAKKFNVNVIWLQIPHMRAAKLNTQMAYLNEVLETETQNRALFIPTKTVLSAGKNEYKESILIDGKETRVRSKDGIHFTPSGMKLIANQIIQYIELNP